MEYNGNVYYYFYNAQGDVMGLYDSNAGIVALYAYDSWGKVLSVTDKDGNAITDKTHVANVNPFRYRGYHYDEETGFYYLNSRYYDPETGRFLNADGFVSTGQGIFSNNMFAYCGNNPINYADPTGRFCVAVMGGVAALLLAVDTLKKISSEKNLQSSKTELSSSQKETQLIVAQTIYGEEHGRTIYSGWQDGQKAIAAVIANRNRAQISYLGKDLETICTNGQFDGYNAGKRAYEENGCDAIAWDSAMELAQCVVLGDYESLSLTGITQEHLYFNATSTYQKNVSKNNGKFSFGPGTSPVIPKGVITYGGNTFFYY